MAGLTIRAVAGPATNELMESKQVKREPGNWLPSFLLKPCVNLIPESCGTMSCGQNHCSTLLAAMQPLSKALLFSIKSTRREIKLSAETVKRGR
jgi:hypothetical protein